MAGQANDRFWSADINRSGEIANQVVTLDEIETVVYTAIASPTGFRWELSLGAIIVPPLDGKRKHTQIIVSGRFALPGIGVVL